MPLTSLQRRVLTASLLAPAAILAVLVLPDPAFALVLGLILLGAAWEWSALAGLSTPASRLAYLALLCLTLLLLQGFLPPAGLLALLVLVSLGWWLLAVALFRLREISAASGPDPRVLVAGLVIPGAARAAPFPPPWGPPSTPGARAPPMNLWGDTKMASAWASSSGGFMSISTYGAAAA